MSVALFAHSDGYMFPLQMGLYPDNTPVVDFEKAWNGSNGDFRAILISGSSIQELVAGLMVAHSIKERGGRIRQAVIPYIPGGRQDRLKWEGDWLFTLKYVAKLINDLHFDKVVTVDPHSLATTALIDRLHVAPVNTAYHFGNIGYDGVIAADAGGVKRAEAVSESIHVPVYFARKHRDPATNKLSGFALDDLPSNQHYLVVDDICDAGGTFVGLGEVIAENGATADLYVTHGLFSKNATERLRKHYNKIYSTDSLDRLVDGVTYITVSKGLALNA